MCGIWALLSQTKITNHSKFYDAFMKIKHRGPDCSSFNLINNYIIAGFHRLAIMDTSAGGNQPFTYVRPDGSCVYCICNGEIYDYEELKLTYDIKTKSQSDCEIIIPLYEKLGIQKMITLLGSEFVFIIFDIAKDGSTKMYVGSDPFGARPLFYGIDDTSICFSSEMKGLMNYSTTIFRFPPGTYASWEVDKLKFTQYYTYNTLKSPITEISMIHEEIRHRFTNSVKRRLSTDRNFGALLSGGLDSSLVCAIIKKLIPDIYFPVFTICFTTGGSDLPYAKKVAKYLDLEHHIIEINPYDALKEIDETIYAIESYDITTVRASIVQKIIAKYIEANTNIKVLLCGENSDEIFQGYKYFHNQPSSEVGQQESIQLVKDVHMFDGLRTDRTMAFHGLEVRLPFIDPEIVDFVFSLPPDLIQPKNKCEKTILRDAFKPLNILPNDVLYRSKEALSDGCSDYGKSWYQYIQEHMETLVSDEEYLSEKDKFHHCPPISKESYYYRKKFVEYFGDSESVAKTIPYFWMPKWCGENNDPSARTLDIYQ